MPQLDAVSFFTQYFWFALVFIGFYLHSVKNIIPQISRLQKVRKAKTAGGSDSTSQPIHQEQADTQSAVDALILKGVSAAKDQLKARFENSQTWVSQNFQQASASDFKAANQAYLNDFIQARMAHYLGLAQAEIVAGAPIPKTGAKSRLSSRLLKGFKEKSFKVKKA